jgi:bacterial/archaeal transporter family-2 protein
MTKQHASLGSPSIGAIQTIFAVLFTLVLGFAIVLQAGMNVRLGKALGNNGLYSATYTFGASFFLLLPVVVLQNVLKTDSVADLQRQSTTAADSSGLDASDSIAAAAASDASATSGAAPPLEMSLRQVRIDETSRSSDDDIDNDSDNQLQEHIEDSSNDNNIVLDQDLEVTVIQMQTSWRDAPLFLYFAGTLGAYFVAASIIFTPKIGLSIFFTLSILGQLISSSVLDHYGWLGLPVRKVTWYNVVGVLLACGGAVLLQDVANPDLDDVSVPELIAFSIGSVVAGAVLPIQATMNKKMSQYAGGTVRGVCLSYLEGFVSLCIACVVLLTTRDWEWEFESPDPSIVWYVPIIISVSYVGGSTVLGPMISLVVFYIVLILGQLGGSLLLDAVGFMDFKEKAPTLTRASGVALAFAGVLAARFELLASFIHRKWKERRIDGARVNVELY